MSVYNNYYGGLGSGYGGLGCGAGCAYGGCVYTANVHAAMEDTGLLASSKKF